jgi:hypothetical protein
LAISVRVSTTNEVSLVVYHLLLNDKVILGPGHIGVVGVGDVIKSIPKLGAMVSTFVAVLSGRVVEVVSVYVTLSTTSSPINRPAPYADAAKIPVELLSTLGSLGGVLTRFKLKELICEVTK